MLVDAVPSRQDKNGAQSSVYEQVLKAVTWLPTIGPKTAEKLVTQFGEEMLAESFGKQYSGVFQFDRTITVILSSATARQRAWIGRSAETKFSAWSRRLSTDRIHQALSTEKLFRPDGG